MQSRSRVQHRLHAAAAEQSAKEHYERAQKASTSGHDVTAVYELDQAYQQMQKVVLHLSYASCEETN